MEGRGWIITLGIVIVSAFTLTWLGSSGMASSALPNISWSILFQIVGLLLTLGIVSTLWKTRPIETKRYAVPGASVILSCLMIYLYRDGFDGLANRLVADTAASSGSADQSGEVTISASQRGQFTASAMVNGSHVDFLVDTGASLVVLTEFDALRLGFTRDDLVYDRPVRTANGRTFAASIMLDAITIGDIEVTNVRSAVMEDGLDISLLGMTFLNQLDSFTIDQDRLVMRR